MIYKGIIEYIKREQKTSQGGKPYTSLSIKMDDGQWYNGFGNKSNSIWNKGDEIDLEYEIQNYKGKEYRKLINKPANVTREEFESLVKRVEKLEQVTVSMLEQGSSDDIPPIDDKDIPF